MAKNPFSVVEAQAKTGASKNMNPEQLVGMTFNMPKDWHTRFKMRALQEDMSMRDLLFQVFAHYERTTEL